MTVVYYALGGGLGHLTRARKMRDAVILTASPFAHVLDGLRVVQVASPEQIVPTIESLAPERLIVDTFPAGLFGELGGMRIDYVARYLKWDEYQKCITTRPIIEHVEVLEPLDPRHEQFIVECGGSPPPFVPVTKAAASRRTPSYVLIVHSGPAEEIDELIAYAREVCRAEGVGLPLLLCAPILRPGIDCIDEYPATELAQSAALIFTGGGFNAMREFGGDDRHRPLPFERRFDDQFLRVALTRLNASAAGA